MGYREIGKLMGISHQGIAFIERRALAKVALALGLPLDTVGSHLREHMRIELRRSSKRSL